MHPVLFFVAFFAASGYATHFIRVNQVGYLPDAPKVAVVCALDRVPVTTFIVRDDRDRVVFGPKPARAAGPFGPCVATYRLDFSALRRSGRFTLAAGGARSPVVRIGRDVYAGAADTLLYYLRQQRSGFNPFFKDSVHRLDGNVIDDSGHVVRYEPVSGGWADASDYLQYVATSATATFDLLMSYRDSRDAFHDAFKADGLPGANGVADVLDEARHGLEWLLKMFPADSAMYNQLADDRDHSYFDLPINDSSDYGWGKGKQRPVYPCTGRPQGLFKYKNRSTGYASTAGKFAAAFALGAQLYANTDTALSALLKRNAGAADRKRLTRYYRIGLDAVTGRAANGFRVGVPFIWCSNDLMAAFATQANLYRRMSGDVNYREYEQAAVDWLFGTNPWGTSMIIGYPRGGHWAHDPHSAVAARFGPEALTGGLLDGPVYRSIFKNLRGIALHEADEYAPFNNGFIVYHDDIGDYSTNEPIMDGTASLVYLMAAYAPNANK